MVLLALVVLQVCHASGVAGFGSVTNVSRKWCERGAMERQTPKKRTIAAYSYGIAMYAIYATPTSFKLYQKCLPSIKNACTERDEQHFS